MNFSGLYEAELFLHNPTCKWIDCKKISGTNCFCDPLSLNWLKALISPYSYHGIHLIDNGNYHYITKLWTDKINSPFSLVLFDHHSDMKPSLFSELLSCGSWVREMLETNKYLKIVCIIGASENQIPKEDKFAERLIYFSDTTLKESWEVFSSMYLMEPVYISVDKDVLSPTVTHTNWDQGSMTLAELEKLLKLIVRHEKIAGIDICGGPSPENLNLHDYKSNEALINFISKCLPI